MALPARGTLGQKVDYNGYTYQWTGVGWNNIGVSKIAVTNQVTVGNGNIAGNTVVTPNKIDNGNTTTNSSFSTNTLSISNTTANTILTPGKIFLGNSTSNVSLSSDGGLSVGNTTSNLKLGSNNISLGNSTVNGFITSNGVFVGNSSYTTYTSANGVLTGNSLIKVSISANGYTSINSIANSLITIDQVAIVNSSTTGRLTSNTLYVGNNSSRVQIYGNTIFVGNSNVNAVITSNLTSIYFTGTSWYANLSNDSNMLAGVPANKYVSTTADYIITGNYTFDKRITFTNTAGVGSYTAHIWTDPYGAWFDGTSYYSLDTSKLAGVEAVNYAKFSDLSSQGYMRNSSSYTISGNWTQTGTFTKTTNPLEIRGTTLVLNSTAGSLGAIMASGSKGNPGQILVSNGSTQYWDDASAVVDQTATYSWTNTHSFSNTITFGNNTIYARISSNTTVTYFSGLANNSLYLGGVVSSSYALKTYADSTAATAYANAMANTLTRNATYSGYNIFSNVNTSFSSATSYVSIAATTAPGGLNIGSATVNTFANSSSISISSPTIATNILNNKLYVGNSTVYANVTNGSIYLYNNAVSASINSVYYTGTSNSSLRLGNYLINPTLTFSGSGYLSAPIVTLTFANLATSTTAVTVSMNSGRVSSLNVISTPDDVLGPVSVSIASPTSVYFQGKNDVSIVDETIDLTTASNPFLVGDYVKYNTTGAAIGGLTNNNNYYIVYSVDSKVKLSLTNNGPVINFTAVGSDDSNHRLTGERATATISFGGLNANNYLLKTKYGQYSGLRETDITFDGNETFTNSVVFTSTSDIIVDTSSVNFNNTVNIANTLSITKIALPHSYVDIDGNLITAPNTGLGGQLLASNGGSNAYWFTVGGGAGGVGSVYEVRSANGLAGGPIVGQGQLYVNANTGIVSNTNGLFVNTAYIQSLDVHGASMLGGYLASAYAKLESPSFTGVVTITGNLNIIGNTVTFGANNLVVRDALMSLHSPESLGPLTINDGRLVGVAYHYYDTADRQAMMVLNQTNAMMTYWKTSTDVSAVAENPAGIAMGTIQVGNLVIGNGTITTTGSLAVFGNNTINATIGTNTTAVYFTGTSYNALQINGVDPSTGYLGATNSVQFNKTLGKTVFANLIGINTAVALAGSNGVAGQVLTSNGDSNVYWSYASTGVTNIDSGNGLTGGPITTTGSLSVLPVTGGGINVTSSGVSVFGNAYSTIVNTQGIHVRANSGLTVNSTGLHVVWSNSTNLANTGIVANSSGVFVNTSFIEYLTSNNTNYLGGYSAASYIRSSQDIMFTGNLTFGSSTNGANAVFNSNVTFKKYLLTNIIPSPNNDLTLGNTVNVWKSIYLGNTGGIYLGTMRITQDSFGALAIPSLTVEDFITANTFSANQITISEGASLNVISASTLTLANALAVPYGGTGLESAAVGDILYANSTLTFDTLSIPSGAGAFANGQILQIINNLPAYGSIDCGTFDD